MKEALLCAHRITHRFGGLVALDDVSLNLERGSIHAVIGTNGAGKSTLVCALAGELAPMAGRILLNGHDATHWSQARRARAGIGRSYQRTTIFPELSVHENCRITAQARRQRFWDWATDARHCAFSKEAADRAIGLAGLENERSTIAGQLSHGHKRQLEIGMCLAMEPDILLLDEPLAGMGSEETARMLGLLETLKRDHAILLVEHDMDAVFRIADEITVMVNGAVIAHGDPDSIRCNALVQSAYLGDAS